MSPGDAAENRRALKHGEPVFRLFPGEVRAEPPRLQSRLGQQPPAAFTDLRELQRRLQAQGVELVQEADETTTGSASFLTVDPDGNPVLVDQHV